MDVEAMEIPKEQAQEEYEAYKEALKTHKDQYISDMKALYGHMRHGRAVLDIYKAFEDAGVNEKNEPKLAICRADSKMCFCTSYKEGRVTFLHDRGFPSADQWRRGHWKVSKSDVSLPNGTLKHENWKDRWEMNLQTLVPTIPARFLNVLRTSLQNYFVLWEVEEWKRVPPRDPMLLKRITPNMFVVLATWDLTELERAVIKGRIH